MKKTYVVKGVFHEKKHMLLREFSMKKTYVVCVH